MNKQKLIFIFWCSNNTYCKGFRPNIRGKLEAMEVVSTTSLSWVPNLCKDFRRSVPECMSKLKSLALAGRVMDVGSNGGEAKSKLRAGVGEILKNSHHPRTTGVFVSAPVCLPRCSNTEAKKELSRTVEALGNVAFGEGQLTVEPDAFRSNRA